MSPSSPKLTVSRDGTDAAYQCSQSPFIFPLILSYGTLLMLLTIASTFLARNYSAHFAESKGVGFAIYHMVIVLALFIGFGTIGGGNPDVVILLCGLAIWWVTMVTIAAIFGPRLLLHLYHGDLDQDQVQEIVMEHVLKKVG